MTDRIALKDDEAAETSALLLPIARGCSIPLQERLQKYPPVLSVKDLEEILRISHNTAYALVRSGQIHSVRAGRSYRIPINAVVDYLKKN